MNLKRLESIALALIISISLSAQDNNLSLEEAIDLACRQSFDAFKNENFIREKHYAYMDHLNLFKPTLSLSLTPANYNRSLQQVYDSEQKQMVYEDIHNFSMRSGLTLKQNVKFTGGVLGASTSLNRYQKFGDVNDLDYISTPVKINYAQDLFAVNEFKWKSKLEPLALEKATQQYISEREQIAIKTITLYFALLEAESRLKIASNNLRRSEVLFNMGKERYRINAIALDELYQLELRKLKAGSALQETKNKHSSVLRELASYLELTTEQIKFCDVPDNMPVSFISDQQSLELTKKNNPDYTLYKEMAMQAEYNLAKARSNRFSASVDVGVGLNKNADNLQAAYIDPTETENARVSLNIPILDWGKTKRNIEKARYNKDETEWFIKKEKENLENELRDLVMDFNIQKSQVENAAKADTLARITYDMVEKRFRNGSVGILNLNDAQNEMERTRGDYLNALRNYWLTYFRIRQFCLYDFIAEEHLANQLKEELDNLSQ